MSIIGQIFLQQKTTTTVFPLCLGVRIFPEFHRLLDIFVKTFLDPNIMPMSQLPISWLVIQDKTVCLFSMTSMLNFLFIVNSCGKIATRYTPFTDGTLSECFVWKKAKVLNFV
jgi:hypothetical protein